MPAKRIIIGQRLSSAMHYKYVLWADVPAGNQLAYRNPTATSHYENISPTELQALRDGQVVERAGVCKASAGTTMATIQGTLEGYWTAFQNEITNEAPWADYGRYWSNVPAWNASTGVPWRWPTIDDNTAATFFTLTPVSAYAANKFHFVLFNNAPIATSQGLVVRIALVVILPGVTAVTGAAPSVWTLRRRENPTTAPSGAGVVVPSAADSAHVLPTQIGCWSAPGTAPAGGTLVPFIEFVPQADEQKVSTLDAPTVSALFSQSGGQVIYSAGNIVGSRALTIRPNQTLEVQQSATAGTGNCRVLCVFTL